jgi:hypothetical protein
MTVRHEQLLAQTKELHLGPENCRNSQMQKLKYLRPAAVPPRASRL